MVIGLQSVPIETAGGCDWNCDRNSAALSVPHLHGRGTLSCSTLPHRQRDENGPFRGRLIAPSAALTATGLRSLPAIGPIGCRAITPSLFGKPGFDLRGEFLCLPHDRIQFCEQRRELVRCQVGHSGSRCDEIQAGSVRLTRSLRSQDGPLTFDLLFSLEAGLQHPEFPCECAKLSNHVGRPLRTQRLSATDQHRLARHGWENATIRRLPAERHFIVGN